MSRSTGSRRTCRSPAAQPVHGEQPPVHGRDADHHGHHDGPPEQRRQQRPGGVRRALGQQRAPRPQREQRVGLRRGGRGVLGGDDAQGQQLGGDEIADLVGGQGPAKVLADQLRDGGRVAGAVDPAGHPVQQRRHLDDLAVGPPHQRRRLGVAGTLVLAEQLDPVGQPGHLTGPGRIRGRQDRRRPSGGHVPCDCGHGSAPPSSACLPPGTGSSWRAAQGTLGRPSKPAVQPPSGTAQQGQRASRAGATGCC